MSVHPLSWRPEYVLHDTWCEKRKEEIKKADLLLAIAAKPDFFISEHDNEDERAAAMCAVGALARRMPPEWCARARVILEESARDDCEKCRLHAAQAVAALDWLDSGWVYRFGCAILSWISADCA